MTRTLCFGRFAALSLIFLTALHLAAGDTLTFRAETPISGDLTPIVLTLSDTDDGVLIELSLEPGSGDLLGLFGNLSDESLLPAITVIDPDNGISAMQFKANKVSQVGGGNNVNPVKKWDFGVKFGRQGSADGFVAQVAFTLAAPGLTTAHLTEALNRGWLFGVRIQSTSGGEGSSKMGIGPDDLQPVENTAPVITSIPVTEAVVGQTWTYQLLAEDADNDPLSYTASQGPTGMSVDADGLVTWLPESEGTATVTFAVSDGQDEVTQQFDLTIAPPPNTPPVITSTPLTEAVVGQIWTYQLLAEDADNDPLSYTVSQGPTGMSVDADGLVTWLPELEGTATVTLAVSDGQDEVTQQFDLTIVPPPNTPPVITSTPLTEAVVGQIWTYQLLAEDADNDPLSYTVSQGPTGMSVDADGLVSWQPESEGTATVTLAVSDGQDEVTQQFDLTIAPPPNGPPVLRTESLPQATLFAPYTHQLEAEDPENDPLTYQLLAAPAGLSLDPQTGVLTWVPDHGQSGTHTVTVAVSDPEGLTDEATWNLTTDIANRAPVFTSSPNTTHLLIPAVGDAEPLVYAGWGHNWSMVQFDGYGAGYWREATSGTDRVSQLGNGDPTVWLSDDDLANGRLQGSLEVTSGTDDDYIGFVFGWQDQRNFYLFDWKRGSQNEALAGMNIKRIRANPLADRTRLPFWDTMTDELTDGVVNLYHNDIPWQRNTLYTVTIDFYPGEIAVEVRTESEVIATFAVQDASYTTGRFGFYNFSQEKTHYNGFTREITAGRTWTYQLTATDPDGDALTYTLLEAPPKLILTEDNQLRWHTTTADEGTHPIRVAVSDGSTTVEQAFNLTVSFQHPVIQGQPETLARVDQPYSYAPGAVDPTPGDTLSFQLDPAPAGMTVGETNGQVSWTPTTADIGEHPVGLHVADSTGNITTLNWNLEVVEAGNARPRLAAAMPATASSGQPYLWRAEAMDPDGDALLFDLPQAPEGMAVNASTGLVSWQPLGSGERRAEIRVTDPGGLWDLRATTITLVDNAAPTFTTQPNTSAMAYRPWQYLAEAVDPEGDALSYQLLRFPPGLTVNATTGELSWQPRPEHIGTHSITLAATDSQGASATQVFQLTVEPFANGPLTITTIPPTRVRPGEEYIYWAKAEDPEGDPLTWYFAKAPVGMTLDNGLVRWTPSNVGTADVGIRVRDDYDGLSGQTYTIDVVPNTPPVFTSDPVTEILAGTPYEATATATDADGDSLTFRLDFGPLGMTVEETTGVISWLPGGDQLGTHAVTISVVDGWGGEATQEFFVEVLGEENSAPVFTSEPETLRSRGESWNYTPTVVDPEGDTVTLNLEEAPTGLAFNGTTLSWTPTEAGSNIIVITATDARGASTRQPFALNVQHQGNTAPGFSSQPIEQAWAGTLYMYDAEVIDPDGYPITFALTNAPEGMNLDRTRGIVTWTPTLAQLGSHQVTMTVTDAHDASDTQRWNITVNDPGDIIPPEVSAFINTTIVQPGETATLWLEASDAGGIASRSLAVNSQDLPLDSQDRAEFTTEVSGNYTAVATATDNAGNESTHTIHFTVADPSDTTAPLVAIHSPTHDSTVTAPTDVIISVTDDNLAEWMIEVGKLGEDCTTELARGTAQLTEEVGGLLDVSLMPNGLYELTLTAFDINGAGTATTHHVAVEDNFKIGRFTMGFEDLSIPLRGIPATVSRFYDSTDKCPGDFGYGWNRADVDLKVNTVFGNSWERIDSQVDVDGFPVPRYCIEGTRNHYVHITFPGGKTESFDLIPSIENGNDGDGNEACIDITTPDRIIPRFEPRPGTYSTLTVLDATDLFFRQAENEHGEIAWRITTSDFTPWEPERFELKTNDGIRYLIHRTEGLQQVTDLEGNRLELRPEGQFYFSSIAPVSAKAATPDLAITYEHDEVGRITAIIDHNGNRTSYAYDEQGNLVSVTDPAGEVTTYHYDAYHNLEALTDPNGDIPTRMIYDDNGRLIAQEDAYGNRIAFDHDIAGNQEVITDQNGLLWVYVYDDRGNVVSLTNPLGEITRTTYDAFDRETSRTIAYGTPQAATMTRTYDALGNITSETDPLGNTYSTEFDDRSLAHVFTDPLGHSVSLAYDDYGRLVSVTDQLGAVTTASYRIDETKRLMVVDVTDPMGQVTTHEQNHYGYVVAKIDQEGRRTEYAHDAFGNIRLERKYLTNSQGVTQPVTWTTDYDFDSMPLVETDPEGLSERMLYDGMGRLIEKIDGTGYRVTYAYDADGNHYRTSYPDGTTEVRTFVTGNRLVSETDRAGRTTTYQHDALGRVIRTTYPDGTEYATGYDVAGNLSELEDPRGFVMSFSYDLAEQRTGRIDPEGNHWETRYDERGFLTTQIDPLNRLTHYDFDAKGRPSGEGYADNTRNEMTYDALDRVTTYTDQKGAVTRFGYNMVGNLTTVTDALGQVTRYGYDELGNRIRQIDANGHVTSFDYDGKRRPVGRTLPLGQTERTVYDSLNRKVLQTDFNGHVTEHQYSGEGLLLETLHADGTQDTWTYTASQEIETVTDIRGATHYAYDLMDRLRRVDHPDGSWIAYDYDESGNRTRVSTNTGDTLFSFDGLSRLESVTEPDGSVTRYTYTSTSQQASINHGNGLRTTFEYDPLDRLLKTTTHDLLGNVVDGYSYTLDEGGMRTNVSSHTGRQVSYEYDALYRLKLENITDAELGDYVFAYTYDAVGNRLTRSINGEVIAYGYDANDRLITEGQNRYTYDAAGNTLTLTGLDSSIQYRYNTAGRLVEVANGETTMTFAYDAAGIRIAETVNGQETKFLVDQNRLYAQVLAEIKADGSGASYVFGDDLLSRTADTGEKSHYLVDGHGSTTALADATGEITDTYAYDAFGNQLASAGTTTNPFQYTGEQFSDGLGFYYLRSRYYNPQIGRFHSMDSWMGRRQKPLTLNKYLYADGNPVMGLDPTGESTLVEQLTTMSKVISFMFSAHAVYTSIATGNYEDLGRDVVLSMLFGGMGKWGIKWIAKAFSKACFVAGTLVATPDGLVPIEDVDVGDVVYSRDEATGVTVASAVEQTFRSDVDQIYHLKYQIEGEWFSLETTTEHPFWVLGQDTWIIAGDLRPGDEFITLSGKPAELASVRISRGKTAVFNFEVERTSSYFVAPREYDRMGLSVWVHNAPCKKYLKLTRKNLRKNMGRMQGIEPPKGKDAHHVFPFALREKFKKFNFDINDPKYGAWWDKGVHQSTANAYNKQWMDFFRRNNDNPSMDQVMSFGRKIAEDYGLEVFF